MWDQSTWGYQPARPAKPAKPEALSEYPSWQTWVHESMRKIPGVPLPFPLPWILIAGIIWGMGAALLYFFVDLSYIYADYLDPVYLDYLFPHSLDYPQRIYLKYTPPASLGKQNQYLLLLILCVVIAALANAVVYFETLIDDIVESYPALIEETPQTSTEWMLTWQRNIFQYPWNIIFGAGMTALIMLCYREGNLKAFPDEMVRYYSYGVLTVVGFLSGSMLWVMLQVARMFFSLGRDVNIKLSVFDSRTNILSDASNILWKIAISSAFIYCIGISAYYFCRVKIDTISVAANIFFGLIIVGFFIIPQINIHKTMSKLKRERLGDLVDQIDRAYDLVAGNPSIKNRDKLRDLFQLQGVVNGKRVWAFGTKELLALFGTVMIPLALFFLDEFFNGD